MIITINSNNIIITANDTDAYEPIYACPKPYSAQIDNTTVSAVTASAVAASAVAAPTVAVF